MSAAINQYNRPMGHLAINVEASDVREKIRKRKIGNTIVFIVDSSGSMGVQQRMAETKSAILSLLVDAYQKRDKVALIVFKQNKAEVVLPPTSSVELAKAYLEIIPTGGKSPLSHGIMAGIECILSELKKQKDCKPLMVLISDGRANVSIDKEKNPIEEALQISSRIKNMKTDTIVIDTEKGFLKLGKLRDIADSMGAKYLHLEELRADKIIDALEIKK
jgi:magnesium chelatase subunit D